MNPCDIGRCIQPVKFTTHFPDKSINLCVHHFLDWIEIVVGIHPVPPRRDVTESRVFAATETESFRSL